MNEYEQGRIRELLKQCVAPARDDMAPRRDLWPEVLRRLDGTRVVPWFDLLLAGGLAVLIIGFPSAIPVFLFYL